MSKIDLAEMERIVRKASFKPTSYDGTVRAVARLVLEYIERHPEDVGAPVDDIFDWDSIRAEWALMKDSSADDQVAVMMRHRTSKGLYERIIEKDSEQRETFSHLGMTGYQWGAGFNLAMQILKLPGQPNPAIVVLP